MSRKYVLTNETIEFKGYVLHRIVAVRDFCGVEAGEFGGFIEKEDNLSQDGNAWVYGNAKVYGDSFVCGNAQVGEDARICGYAIVKGDETPVRKMTNRELFEKEKYSFSKVIELFNDSGMSDFNEFLNDTP